VAELLNWIMDSIRSYGAWSVFLGVIIESVIVPIPSPLIIMGAGFVLISPQFSFFEALVPILLQIVLPGSVASTLGAYIGYGIGYFGGKTWSIAGRGFLDLTGTTSRRLNGVFRVAGSTPRFSFCGHCQFFRYRSSPQRQGCSVCRLSSSACGRSMELFRAAFYWATSAGH
jgi:hypothetical protein